MVGVFPGSCLCLQTKSTIPQIQTESNVCSRGCPAFRFSSFMWAKFLRAFYVYRVTELLLNQAESPTLTTEQITERLLSSSILLTNLVLSSMERTSQDKSTQWEDFLLPSLSSTSPAVPVPVLFLRLSRNSDFRPSGKRPQSLWSLPDNQHAKTCLTSSASRLWSTEREDPLRLKRSPPRLLENPEFQRRSERAKYWRSCEWEVFRCTGQLRATSMPAYLQLLLWENKEDASNDWKARWKMLILASRPRRDFWTTCAHLKAFHLPPQLTHVGNCMLLVCKPQFV